MEKTLYFDTLKVTFNGQVLIYFKIGSYAFDLLYRVVQWEKFNQIATEKNATIEVIKSVKLNPIFSKSLITNSRGKVLSTADYEAKKAVSPTSCSVMGPETTNEEVLLRALLAAQSSDIKVYKIDGIRVI